MAKKHDKKFEKAPKCNRTFSEEFKRKKVDDLINKRISIRDLMKLYDVSRTSIYNWLYLYSGTEKDTKTVVQMESEATKTKVLQERLSEYERIIGRKQMEIDLLTKCLELASEEVGYDLKKKYAPGHWNGSDNTQKNTVTA